MEKNKKLYDFIVSGFDKDTFEVVKFKGTESISMLYHFNILVISKTFFQDFNELINKNASLYFLGNTSNTVTNGIIADIEFIQYTHECYIYRIILRPEYMWLKNLTRNKIFIDKTTEEIITNTLSECNFFKNQDFTINITNNDVTYPYICMYNESVADFLQYRMESNGIFYYFEHTEEKHIAHILNQPSSLQILPNTPVITYADISMKPQDSESGYILALLKRQVCCPASVEVRDYNYDNAAFAINGQAAIDSEHGFGQIYTYRDNVRTGEEASTLASIRAREFSCRQVVYSGTSTVSSMRAGYAFDLAGHPIDDFNSPEGSGSYLLMEVQHTGQQVGYLSSLLGAKFEQLRSEPTYANSFRALPNNANFVPKRIAQKKRCYGMLSGAVIDGQGEKGTPAIDDQGYYRVIMPFDQSDHECGKASCKLRLMHPYAGKDATFHFPLLKGSEVMIAFENGDPDLPFIAGAVHNSEQPEVKNTANKYQNLMLTPSKQFICLSDEPDNAKVTYGSMDSNTAEQEHYSPYHPRSFKLSGSTYSINSGFCDKLVVGNKFDMVVGTKSSLTLAPQISICHGPKISYQVDSSKKSRENLYKKLLPSKVVELSNSPKWISLQPFNIKHSNTDTYEMGDGSTFTAKASKTNLGQEKATMFGGSTYVLREINKQTEKMIKKLLGLSAALNLSTCIGLGVMAEVADKNATESGTSLSISDLGEEVDLAAAGVATFLQGYLACKLNKLLARNHYYVKKSIEKDNLIGGMVRCSEKGVEIRANSLEKTLSIEPDENHTDLASAQVNLSVVGDENLFEKAALVLGAKGESVELTRGMPKDMNNGYCSLNMKADQLKLETGKQNSTSSLTAASESITMQCGEDTIFEMNYDSLCSYIKSQDGDGSTMLWQTTDTLTIGCDKNSLTLNNTMLEMEVGDASIKITSADLTQKAKKIELKGQQIDIG